MNNPISILLLLLCLVIAVLIYRATSVHALHFTSALHPLNSGMVIGVQIAWLVVCLFSAMVFWWVATPTAERQITAALTESALARTERYYAALGKGIEDGYYWTAYDLLSSCQRRKFTYDDLRKSYEGTWYMDLLHTEALDQTENRAKVLAVVKFVRAINGMLRETKEWNYYDLVKEDGEWRVDSLDMYQQNLAVPENCLCVPDDYSTCGRL